MELSNFANRLVNSTDFPTKVQHDTHFQFLRPPFDIMIHFGPIWRPTMCIDSSADAGVGPSEETWLGPFLGRQRSTKTTANFVLGRTLKGPPRCSVTIIWLATEWSFSRPCGLLGCNGWRSMVLGRTLNCPTVSFSCNVLATWTWMMITTRRSITPRDTISTESS